MMDSSFYDCLKNGLTQSIGENMDVKRFAILSNPLPAALGKDIKNQVKKCFHLTPGGKTPNAVQFLS